MTSTEQREKFLPPYPDFVGKLRPPGDQLNVVREKVSARVGQPARCSEELIAIMLAPTKRALL